MRFHCSIAIWRPGLCFDYRKTCWSLVGVWGVRFYCIKACWRIVEVHGNACGRLAEVLGVCFKLVAKFLGFMDSFVTAENPVRSTLRFRFDCSKACWRIIDVHGHSVD